MRATNGLEIDSAERRNNFSLLRLLFALLVVFSHSFAIGGFGADPLYRLTGGQVTFGFVAVICFFIVSGFLITASATRHPLWRFLLNRAARIMPGFWAVQLLTALVLAPVLILTKHPDVEGYFDSLLVGRNSALSYLGNNALFHIKQYRIADLFVGVPAGPAVNGSLWSLGPEVMCYVYLALFALCGGLRTKLATIVVFAGVYGIHVSACLEPASIHALASWSSKGGVFLLTNTLFRSLYVAFATGMLFYQYRHCLRWNAYWLTLSLVVLIGGCGVRSFDLVWPFTLPYIILYLAYRVPVFDVERWGDFSFGIYIYSFPIQQCLVLAGIHQFGSVAFIGASLLSAFAAGVLSWRWIEAPVLKWARSVQVSQMKPAVPVGDTLCTPKPMVP